MSRVLTRSAALALAAPVLAALGSSRAAAQPFVVRVATATSDSFGEEFYSQDGGFYRKAGLTVEPFIFLAGAQCLTAVIAGKADVGLTNPVSLVEAIQHGVPVTAIAGSCYYNSNAPTTALFVAANAPYQSAKDLEGQTVALLGLRDFAIVGVQQWLRQHGADPAKVKFIEVPGPEMAAALVRGTVAAASIPEPYSTAAGSQIRILGKDFDSIAKRFYISLWATTTAFIQRNPETVRRFVAATYATARWANTHHDATAAILAKYAKMQPALIRSMTRASFAESLDVADLQPMLDAAYAYKIIDAPVKAAEVITIVR
jgi:NitT/TauT family transport system substrate-binding protein